ncbi:MAG: transcriptional repressor, partial [Deltaproteobacteria bacterium]|nr:transcriptional repressor [Deltaproteobacteria bacterium]
MSTRRTRQLEVIWDVLQDERSHPTADRIYERVRREVPHISLGTVYRNLQKLAADGKVQILNIGRTQHFDPILN